MRTGLWRLNVRGHDPDHRYGEGEQVSLCGGQEGQLPEVPVRRQEAPEEEPVPTEVDLKLETSVTNFYMEYWALSLSMEG